ncbi:porin family protein [Lacinutrix salivirga]
MKSITRIILFLLTFASLHAQNDSLQSIDPNYKEDQFYVGITYNLLINKINGMSQSGFSSGFHLGFIKDMPVNKQRNKAIGIGLGYSANSFNQNMLINKENGVVEYSILNKEDIGYTKNKFSMHLLEMPLEYRWRTSTAKDYQFWRIYTGFKMGYLFAHTTKFDGDLGKLKYNDIEDFNTFQYGLTLSAGYNTWNFHVYYALNPIFSDNAKIDGVTLETSAIKVGLLFYIL